MNIIILCVLAYVAIKTIKAISASAESRREANEARREAEAREQRVNQLAEIFRAEREARTVRPECVEDDQEEDEDIFSVADEKIRARLEKAEADISFLKELREREVTLLKCEKRERDACSKESTEWQKWETKVIAREKKLYNINTKLTKARQEKFFCENAM